MTEPTRRDWLRALGAASTAGAAGLAGCSAFDAGGPTGDDTPGNGGPGNGTDDGGSDGGDRPTEASDDGVKTQFRQGLRNTGYIDATIPESVETAWEVPANSGDHSASKGSPIEAPNGAIVLADDTGRVQSIAPDGSVNWATSISDDDRGSHGTPAIADGSLYVGTYDGVVSAVALDDGEILWQTDAGDAAAASPTYLDGKLYVAIIEHATPSGSVVKMDAESGEIEWRDERPTNHPHSTVAIDREHGRLIFGSNDGHCYAWSFPELEREWAYDTGGDVKLPSRSARGSRSSPRGREPSRDSTSRTDPSCGSSRPTAGTSSRAIRPRGHGRRHVRPGGARRRGVRRQPRQQRLRDRPPDRREAVVDRDGRLDHRKRGRHERPRARRLVRREAVRARPRRRVGHLDRRGTRRRDQRPS